MDSTPSPLHDAPRVIGAYRLLDRVASGGSSTVWRARGPDGEIVAVKLLDPAASGTPSERRRFLRGFNVAAMLAHPGIARLLEAGEQEGRLFVVEEFVDGETVADRLRSGRLPVEEALRILRKSAEALGYAHQCGVVHRDLSPRNLMIDQSGRVVLVDFGIAVRPEGTTQPGSNTLLGTLNYLAPELIRGLPASGRSDLYALGSIAYQMLCGSPPFVATRPEALIRLHLKKRPASLRTLRPELDPRVDRLVRRLLAKLPANRFNNADALLHALDEARQPRTRRSIGTNGVPKENGKRPRRPLAGEARAIHRIAIAPFTADLDDGSDPERVGRIALGLAETVAAGLTGVDGLTVVPPRQIQGVSRPTAGALGQALGVDAILNAHLVQRENARRLSWTLVGLDGVALEGGRLGGEGESLFSIEDALLAELIRVLRRPQVSGRLLSAASRESWYGPFLEAIGCLQRTDSESSVDRAIALLEQIRDAGAGGVQVQAALGRAYLRRGEIRREPEWQHRAEACCRIAISLDPLAPEAMLTMGRLLVASGRAAEAIAILDRALELSPRNVDALIWLSRGHEMAGDFAAAERFARLACAERPELWNSHDRLAVLAYRRGRFADAEAEWRRALELTPDNPWVLASLGAALFEQGDLEAAEEAYRDSLEQERSPRALAGLGSVQFYRGNAKQAVHWFRESVERVPGDSRHWGNLADAQRWVEGEREESMSSFDHAIELVRTDLGANPTNANAWGRLALYLAKREQHVEARAALTRALDLGGDSKEIQMRAVIVHELAGSREQALAALDSIVAESTLPFELMEDPELEGLRTAADSRSAPGTSALFQPIPSHSPPARRASK